MTTLFEGSQFLHPSVVPVSRLPNVRKNFVSAKVSHAQSVASTHRARVTKHTDDEDSHSFVRSIQNEDNCGREPNLSLAQGVLYKQRRQDEFGNVRTVRKSGLPFQESSRISRKEYTEKLANTPRLPKKNSSDAPKIFEISHSNFVDEQASLTCNLLKKQEN